MLTLRILKKKKKFEIVFKISNLLRTRTFTLKKDSIYFLSNWVLLESAIKWKRGGIYQEIKNWLLNKSLTLAIN